MMKRGTVREEAAMKKPDITETAMEKQVMEKAALTGITMEEEGILSIKVTEIEVRQETQAEETEIKFRQKETEKHLNLLKSLEKNKVVKSGFLRQ